ncbi:hypothetical protein K2X14_02855 [Acetobacter sp. TBRC 12305]|uniref:DUF2125 domain-containing protein n=1 Tax=Acetobacter garciniae TaxID=2817435 RepID=A0A939HL69_9PROT|nr:hypothetical protein [Acetobacter garciniae]MBO1324096.1 hypothetical protein [Acetobacter garciniae]MBX0343785.1 hypothetical protein [Acetobacter garciniae]
MKHNSFLYFLVRGVVSLGAIAGAGSSALAAAPSGCALIRHAAMQDTPQGVTYDGFSISTPDGGTRLNAAHYVFRGQGASADSLHDQAEAAALLLVSAMSGLHNGACSNWLAAQGRQVAATLKAGKGYDLTWQNATVVHGTAQVGLGSVRYQMQPATPQQISSVSLSMNGVSFHNVANQGLLPSAARAVFSLPANELPALMDAIGGRSTASPAVHATISSLEASQGAIRLQGHGQATLTGNVGNTSASGHLEIANLESLIEKARSEKQIKLAAALVVARLVSHRSGEQNTWDTTWEGGVLTVNGFPLPLR